MTRMASNVADRSGQAALHTRLARRNTVRLKLWLPLTPLWIVLSPIALIAAPILLLVPTTHGIAPYRAAFAVGRVLFSLSGTAVEINTASAVLHVRIF